MRILVTWDDDCINIQQGDRFSKNNSELRKYWSSVSEQDWDKSKLLKIHKWFGHANSEKTVPFFNRDAGIPDVKAFTSVKDILHKCDGVMATQQNPYRNTQQSHV